MCKTLYNLECNSSSILNNFYFGPWNYIYFCLLMERYIFGAHLMDIIEKRFNIEYTSLGLKQSQISLYILRVWGFVLGSFRVWFIGVIGYLPGDFLRFGSWVFGVHFEGSYSWSQAFLGFILEDFNVWIYKASGFGDYFCDE